MPQAARRRMTVAEFLEWDDGTDKHFELIDGAPVAMAPPNDVHSTIMMSFGAELKARLKPPCRPMAQAGIARSQDDDTCYEADIAVACGPPTGGITTEPVVLVEILSPSTASHDRKVKLPAYRELPSVQEVILVSARQRKVEIYRRSAGWRVENLVGDATFRLESVGVEIGLDAIYDGTGL
jgi:Uma2 family endonuclease